MTVQCPKCAYIRQPSDTAPSYECPKCGIIYAKFSAGAEKISKSSSESGAIKTRNSMKSKRLVLIVALILFAFFAIYLTIEKTGPLTEGEVTEKILDEKGLKVLNDTGHMLSPSQWMQLMPDSLNVLEIHDVNFDPGQLRCALNINMDAIMEIARQMNRTTFARCSINGSIINSTNLVKGGDFKRVKIREEVVWVSIWYVKERDAWVVTPLCYNTEMWLNSKKGVPQELMPANASENDGFGIADGKGNMTGGDITCDRSGLSNDWMATASCEYWNGFRKYNCDADQTAYLDDGAGNHTYAPSCEGAGLIHRIPDKCVDDGGKSAGGDSLEIYCVENYARFCLSGEKCVWR